MVGNYPLYIDTFGNSEPYIYFVNEIENLKYRALLRCQREGNSSFRDVIGLHLVQYSEIAKMLRLRDIMFT